MEKSEASWAYQKGNKPSNIHLFLSNLSCRVRHEQFNLFSELLKPRRTDKVADIGVSSVEELVDTNFFEKRYPYPENLTAVSIDEPLDFLKKYPKMKYEKITPGKPLPFADKSFDIVVSWATLEHVGDRQQQQFFLSEILRVGKKIFVTTPYRGCPWEPHSGLLFVHWLPRRWFGKICHLLKKDFWASEDNLRCLWGREARELLPEHNKVQILTYKIFGIIPSHLIIVKV